MELGLDIETPLTDAAAYNVIDANAEYSQSREFNKDGSHVNVDFARDLERKLRLAIIFIEGVPLAKWRYIESGDVAANARYTLTKIQ